MNGAVGALGVPAVLLLMVLTTGVFGTTSVMHRWREIARLQLSLDHCVRGRVREVRDILESVERNNSRMRVLRASIAATAAVPQANAAARKLLEGVALLQAAQRIRWEGLGVRWLARRCSESALVSPPDRFPWRTPAPDLLGARPLEWTGSRRRCFVVVAFRKPRSAAGELSWSEVGWSGRWLSGRAVLADGCNGTD